MLAKKFGTYKIGQYEKRTGKGVMDLLDIGNLEVSKIAEIIKLGNDFPKGTDADEMAYEKLDNYLEASEDNSVITAFFDLIEDLDRDLKIMRSCGLKVSDIKKQFKEEIEKKISDTGLTDAKALVEKAEDI